MIEAHKESNVFRGGSYKQIGQMKSVVVALEANAGASDVRSGSSGLGDGLRTYKRRKKGGALEQGMSWFDAKTRLLESLKKSSDQASQEKSQDLTFTSQDCSLKHQQNIFLDQICQLLKTEDDRRKCIQDVPAFHPGSGSKTTVNESVQSVPDGVQNAVKGNLGISSSGSVYGLNQETLSELCQSIFSDIFMSEKFTRLCSLLLESGMKADKLIDLSHINSRMKEKAYESSIVLFHTDIQEIWTKIQKFGSDIIALAKELSDKTLASFCEQVGSSAHNISEDGIHEKAELTESRTLDQVQNCAHCREKADGTNSVVGIESPHENCIVCERLNNEPFNGCGENELVTNEEDKRFCKICKLEGSNDEEYRKCNHSLCLHKFYHVKCLTSKQLISYGPRWYCPSCLCRACCLDRDDDKIVLCDGCDRAYHIYCMQPPRDSIPTGKWFCTKCDDGIQRLRKARLLYKNVAEKMDLDEELKIEEAMNEAGGVDMLLNAAKTLNCEENLAVGLTVE